MPTRVVFSGDPMDRRRQQFVQHNSQIQQSFSLRKRIESSRSLPLPRVRNHTIRSSLLRSMVSSDDELNREQEGDINSENDDLDASHWRSNHNQSGNGEISSSPRLPLYLNILLSSAVNMVSVIQFWLNEDIDFSLMFSRNNTVESSGSDDTDLLLTTVNGTWLNNNTNITDLDDDDGTDGGITFVDISGLRVFRWKFVGAFVITLLGTVFSLIIVLVHFDTICFPQFWRKVFTDGSPWERNLSILQIAYWTMGVHICTSSFSIGYTQANVFFTSWIALFSAFVVYDLWRVGASLPSFLQFMASTRKTTLYNWLWAMIFAIATAGAVLDIYLTRDYYIFINDEGDFVTPTVELWYVSLVTSLVLALVCALVVLAKIHWKDSKNDYIVYFDDDYRQRRSFLNKLRWYHLEGILIMAMVCVAGYIVLGNTIQNFYANPSNLYFSAWGYFFSALFTLGTWMASSGTWLGNAITTPDDEEERAGGIEEKKEDENENRAEI
mmetsp:Transcript_30002/g.45495  ORF Transcript_30002/g.45495 Transcript_30002/m.45495 type:complete len:496 (+) Transcript_30002:182-1669(+)